MHCWRLGENRGGTHENSLILHLQQLTHLNRTRSLISIFYCHVTKAKRYLLPRDWTSTSHGHGDWELASKYHVTVNWPMPLSCDQKLTYDVTINITVAWLSPIISHHHVTKTAHTTWPIINMPLDTSIVTWPGILQHIASTGNRYSTFVMITWSRNGISRDQGRIYVIMWPSKRSQRDKSSKSWPT